MKLFYFIFILFLIIVGLIMKKKNIKDIIFLNFSIFNILIVIFITVIVIIELIIPIPTYYIRPKEEYFIETIIESEMIATGIKYDTGTLRIVNQFLAKFNQLYFATYEVNGVEEARMFHFKENVFGNLKPSQDFSESKVILKSEKDDGLHYRGVNDGFAKFLVNYGYANNPEVFNNPRVNKYNFSNLNPESYYLIINRTDDFGLLFSTIRLIILLIILNWKAKKENKLDTYTVAIVPGKKLNILEIEYFV